MRRPPARDEVRAHYAALAASYDGRANAACKRAYTALVREWLGGAQRVAELGAGSSPLLAALDARLKAACDLSQPMLAARRAQLGAVPVVADAQALPFGDAQFDAAFCINVLEHVPDPAGLAAEAARVLQPGGRFLAVTPNGDLEWLLDLLEAWRLKLPEGPHRFLKGSELDALCSNDFDLVASRRFLALPAGPAAWVRLIDRLALGHGLFRYVVLRRR